MRHTYIDIDINVAIYMCCAKFSAALAAKAHSSSRNCLFVFQNGIPPKSDNLRI